MTSRTGLEFAYPWERPLGARPIDDGRAEFRVWGPRATTIGLIIDGGREHPPARGLGVFETVTDTAPNSDYAYVVARGATALPDPCSRWQPHGLRGRSRILAGPPARDDFVAPALADAVIYELHIGTFSEAGTFDGAIPHLDELVHLGVNAIEIMP